MSKTTKKLKIVGQFVINSNEPSVLTPFNSKNEESIISKCAELAAYISTGKVHKIVLIK